MSRSAGISLNLASTPHEVREWLAADRQKSILFKQGKIYDERKKELAPAVLSWLQQNDNKVQVGNFSPEDMNRFGSEGTFKVVTKKNEATCNIKHLDTSLTDLLKEFYYKDILPLMKNGPIHFDGLNMPNLPQNGEEDENEEEEEENFAKLDKEGRFWRYQANQMAGKIWQRLPIRSQYQTVEWVSNEKKMEYKQRREQKKKENKAKVNQSQDASMDGSEQQGPIGYRNVPKKFKTQQDRLSAAVGQSPLPPPSHHTHQITHQPQPSQQHVSNSNPSSNYSGGGSSGPAAAAAASIASLQSTFGSAPFQFGGGGGGGGGENNNGSGNFFTMPSSSSSILQAKKY